jgi:hypothetical protein
LKLNSWTTGLTLVALGCAPGALAFHDGGVAYCDGCHSMHNSSGNKVMSGGRNAGLLKCASSHTWPQQVQGGNAYLLQGSDDSSTCLNCHAASDTTANFTGSYHVLTFPIPGGFNVVNSGGIPVERTPGGDFAWLGISTSCKSGYACMFSNKGERHGHNVVAMDYCLIADATLLTAPGGTYPARSLSCASCHDPHSRSRIIDAAGTIVASSFGNAVLPIGQSGSYGATSTPSEAIGVYRLLAGKLYGQDSVQGATQFTANPPIAVAPVVYNRSEAVTDTRVAYGAGMSEWCANCHVSIHNDGVASKNTALIHPAGNGALLSTAANDLKGGSTQTIAGIYNAYVMSGNLNGNQGSSYTSLVPFEEGTTVIATLAAHAVTDGSQKGGPSAGTENVMCLSCHRAHASGFASSARWNNNGECLTLDGAYPGTDAISGGGQGAQYNQGYTTAQYQAAMYDRPATNFAYSQRSLCNKCHAKD